MGGISFAKYLDHIRGYLQEICAIPGKIKGYDSLLQQKLDLENQLRSSSSKVEQLEDSVSDRDSLYVRCDELSRRLESHEIIVGERDSLLEEKRGYQQVIEERNRLIAFQKKSLAELRESYGKEKVKRELDTYTREKSAKGGNVLSQIAGYFSKKKFCKKDSKLASKLIINYGLSAGEVSSVLHSEGILGLCKKRAFLLNERRKSLGKSEMPFSCFKSI